MLILACRMLLVGIEKNNQKIPLYEKTLPNPSKKMGQNW